MSQHASGTLMGRLVNLGWVLALLGVTLCLTLSALTLTTLGVAYDTPGGSPLVKIHPASYCFALALVLALAGRGHPIAVLISRARQMPLMTVYMACMVLVAFWSVWRNGTSGAAFIVDSLWMPGVVVLLLSLYGPQRTRQLLQWMLLLLVMNALLGLVEYALKKPLVERYPFYSDLVADEGLFRASALLGHPLANSLVTAMLLPMAFTVPRTGSQRWAAVLVLVLALLAFGSRTALIVALGIYGLALLLAVALRTVQGRYSYLQLTGGLLAALLALTVVGGTVWATGLGERIFLRLTWDNSANVRVVVWNALGFITDFEWWTGMPPERIEQIAQRIGLDTRYEAIENFWIALLMQFGLIGFVPFLIGLGCGLLHLWRIAPPTMRLAIPVYFVVASGANTLAAKTVSLVLLFAALYGTGTLAAAAAAAAAAASAAASAAGSRRAHGGAGAGQGGAWHRPGRPSHPHMQASA